MQVPDGVVPKNVNPIISIAICMSLPTKTILWFCDLALSHLVLSGGLTFGKHLGPLVHSMCNWRINKDILFIFLMIPFET